MGAVVLGKRISAMERSSGHANAPSAQNKL